MELALRPGFSGPAWMSRAMSAGGRARALVAGVAVVSAGLIATVPVMQHSTGVQHRAVKLVDNSGDLGVVLTEAFDNLAARQAENATNRLGEALIDLNTEYSTRVANDLSAAYDGLLNGLPADYPYYDGPSGLLALPEVINSALENIANGDIVQAFSDVNEYNLYGLLGGTLPLYDLINNNFADLGPDAPPVGAVGVIGELSQINTQVIQEFFSLNTGAYSSYALLGPLIAAGFRASIEAETFNDQLGDGNFAAAFQTLAETPTRILDSYLNGDDFSDYGPIFNNPDYEGAAPGLLTGDGGTLQWFGFTLPNNIADALHYTAPDAPADAAGAAAAAADAPGNFDLASLFDLPGNFDLASVFDGSWLTDLFNPADAVGAAVSGLAG